MPTKQWYLDNYSDTASMHAYAISANSCCTGLGYIKVLATGQKEIKVHEEGNEANFATGIGADKREALATALATFTA